MAEIKKLFKFGNIWGIGGFWAGTNSEYYIFSSRETIIKEGKRIPEYELKIEKTHPIFANIELKQDDINDTFTVDYEMTFDPEKGKQSLSGQIEENERHYRVSESLTLKEIKKEKDDPNDRERERETNFSTSE